MRVAGSGPALDALAAEAANHNWLSIPNKYLSAGELEDEVTNSDVLVLPYIEGSASGLIALGLGFGKCVVASDVGTFQEYIEHGRTGLLVEPRSVEALCDALEGLAGDQGRVQMMKRSAYIDGQSRFSPDTIASRTLEVYAAASNSRKKHMNRSQIFNPAASSR